MKVWHTISKVPIPINPPERNGLTKGIKQMAHLIEADHMVYAGDKPWHGIGEHLGVSDNASIEAAIAAKPIIGSTLSHLPATVNVGGIHKVIPDAWACVRDFDGKVLACVGAQQRLSGSSPRRMLQSLQNIVGPGKGALHTAMYLREGAVFVCTVKLGAPTGVTRERAYREAREILTYTNESEWY